MNNTKSNKKYKYVIKEDFSDNGIRFNNSRIILICLLILLACILILNK
jgi:hypothetical protein